MCAFTTPVQSVFRVHNANKQISVRIGWRTLNMPHYADGTTTVTETVEELNTVLTRVKCDSGSHG